MLNFSGRRALPVIMQSEASECGLACLAMVASYYGHRIDLSTLRRQHPISLNGVTLRSVIEIARHMDFTTRAVRLEPEDLKQIKRPAILHWDMNHFVVLKSGSKRGIVLHDPAIGEKRVSWGEVSKHLTGVALELTPTEVSNARTSGRGCVSRRSSARRAEQNMRSYRFSPCHSRSSFSSSPGLCSLPWTRSSPGAMSTC
ncbi:MAG: cysteine peptidase family C39 domain-containing protein [Methyloceanibacter sp.]